MASLTLIASLVVAGTFAFFAWRRALTYLHVFQQEEYDGGRFLGWLFRTFDRRHARQRRAGGAGRRVPVGRGAGGHRHRLCLRRRDLRLFRAGSEPDPRQVAKKKLVVTTRARRILIASGVLMALIVGALVVWQAPLLAWIARGATDPVRARCSAISC